MKLSAVIKKCVSSIADTHWEDLLHCGNYDFIGNLIIYVYIKWCFIVFIQLLIGLCLPIVLSLVYVSVFTLPIIRLQHIIGDEFNHCDYGNTREDSYFQLNRRIVDVVLWTSSFLLQCQQYRWFETYDFTYHLWSIDIPIVEELSVTIHTNKENLQWDSQNAQDPL